jgi:hypothetical protein
MKSQVFDNPRCKATFWQPVECNWSSWARGQPHHHQPSLWRHRSTFVNFHWATRRSSDLALGQLNQPKPTSRVPSRRRTSPRETKSASRRNHRPKPQSIKPQSLKSVRVEGISIYWQRVKRIQESRGTSWVAVCRSGGGDGSAWKTKWL